MTAFNDDRRPARRRLFRVARTRGLLQTSLVLILCLLMAAPGLPGASRKAKQLYEQGRRAEVQKDYDGALRLYEQAQVEDPGDNRYQLSVRRMRFVAAQAHVDAGRRLRDDEGLLDEALAHFQRAIEIDPSLTAASQQYQRTLDMIEKRRGGGTQQDDDGNASALELDREERRKLVESMRAPAVLRPLSTQPIDITMSQQLKVVYETIGKLAGINVLFDPDFSDKRVDISIQDATLTEALDYTALITQTYWKPITHNAIFVTNDTTAKRRDFEEKIVKTIYLNNVATPQELQEIVTAIRGLTDIRRMFPVTSMNALVVRGSRSELALVDKLINDIDKARPEVVIDVLVLEVSRSKTRELGISPTSGGVPGLSVPAIFTGGAALAEGDDAPAAGVALSRLGSVGTRDWVTTLPGAQLTALFSSSDSNLLQSPRIRATDNQQASLRIGERIPIATGSFQPGIGGVGANALVNTQFNFEEVGVNIDILPKVHNDREISMHLSIEVSNVRAFKDLGGIEQPIISQKTIEHDIRLEEGEASILGGLHQDSVFTTKSGIPFLGEIPILGRLFSVRKVDTAQNEILIVVIPHIVRLPTVDASNLLEIASGTEQVFQVGFKEESSGEAALPAPGAPVQAETPTPATQTPGAPAPAAAVPGAPNLGDPAAPDVPPAATPTPTEQPATPAQPAAASRLLFEPGQAAFGAGDEITVSVLADGVTDLFGSPLRIAFDPAVVNIVEITRGDFLAGPERTDLIFSRNIRNQVGQSAVNISRFPGTGGATGRGELIQIRLRGVAPGQTQLNVSPTGARRADGNPMNLQAASLQLTVQ